MGLALSRGLVEAMGGTLTVATQAHVLYVEDNLSNLRLAERILKRRPEWTLTHAGGGVSGLELALARRFDLILSTRIYPT